MVFEIIDHKNQFIEQSSRSGRELPFFLHRTQIRQFFLFSILLGWDSIADFPQTFRDTGGVNRKTGIFSNMILTSFLI